MYLGSTNIMPHDFEMELFARGDKYAMSGLGMLAGSYLDEVLSTSSIVLLIFNIFIYFVGRCSLCSH